MPRPDRKRPANGKSATRTTVYLPSALVQRLRHYKGRINLSKVAAEALTFEVERQEALDAEWHAAQGWLAQL